MTTATTMTISDDSLYSMSVCVIYTARKLFMIGISWTKCFKILCGFGRCFNVSNGCRILKSDRNIKNITRLSQSSVHNEVLNVMKGIFVLRIL